MALYIYHAFSRDGKRVTGTLDATSAKQVRDSLARSGLYIVSIAPASQATTARSWWAVLTERPVSIKDKIFFTKQLSVLLRSGIPLVDALTLLIEQSTGKLRSITITLRDGIKEGRSFADGLADYPKIFEPLYVQLVRAGEASGKLEAILERLTEYLERNYELKRRISGELIYPGILLGLIVGAVIALLKFVVPQILTLFEDQQTELPWATRFLDAASNFVQRRYLLIIIFIVGAFILYRLWKATPRGAKTIDAIKLKIPIVRYFAQTGAVVRFSRTLGMLLEGGVGLAEALDIVCNIVDNRILVDTLKQAREQIIKQGRVAEYLKKTELFPPLAIYLISTGEQSSALDSMLTAVAKQYETELTEYTEGLVTKLNPLLMGVMFISVGFIMMAILMPIFKMVDTFSRQV